MKFLVYICLVLIFGTIITRKRATFRKAKKGSGDGDVRSRLSSIKKGVGHLESSLTNFHNKYSKIGNKRKALDVIENSRIVDISHIVDHPTYKTDKATHKLLSKALDDYKDLPFYYAIHDKLYNIIKEDSYIHNPLDLIQTNLPNVAVEAKREYLSKNIKAPCGLKY
jgi:hypothetical protein